MISFENPLLRITIEFKDKELKKYEKNILAEDYLITIIDKGIEIALGPKADVLQTKALRDYTAFVLGAPAVRLVLSKDNVMVLERVPMHNQTQSI